jgi:tetratricopeptide (TPR) repeat protein
MLTMPVLNAWLLLAEGLGDFYADLSLRSHERVRRSLALGKAARNARVQSLAAAWLAHLDFYVRDDASALEHVALALKLARSDHHGARSRASLVVAGMLHYARRDEESQAWYALARRHATTEGDGAALSSIMYNMAFLRVLDARVADLRDPGGCPEGVLRRAVLGTESSVHLDRSVQTRALSNHPPMRRAQILLLTGEIEAALALYEEHTRKAIEEGLGVSESVFRADQAWCLAMLGRSDAALRTARDAEAALHGAVEPEDLVIAHGMLERVFRRLGLDEVAAIHEDRGAAHYRVYSDRIAALLAGLDRLGLRTAPC